MRLSLSQSEQAAEESFALASSMADLGYHTRLGSWITACDAEYPWDPNIVRAIRREFDPAWTPLFCREAWMAPGTKGVVVIGRHMVARHVPVPHSETDVLKVHGLPHNGRYDGITFKTPLLEAMTLEKRPAPDDVEQSAGGMVRRELGEYVPFDNRVYLTCKAMWQQNHSQRAKELAQEIAYLQVDKPKEEGMKAMEELRYQLKNDWAYLERKRKSETDADRKKAAQQPETAPMVFVGKAAGSTPAIGVA